jgi:signal transduction histidine kinase
MIPLPEHPVREFPDAQLHRLAAVGQHVLMCMHEVRNVLAVAGARVGRLERTLRDIRQELSASPSDDAVRAAMDEALAETQSIKSAQARLSGLLDDFRDFGGPFAILSRPCRTDLILESAVNDVQTTHGVECLWVEQDWQTANVWCMGDPNRLEQLFRILLENSVAACPAPTRVCITWSDGALFDQPALQISIRDYGPGFSEEARHRLFQPFFTTKPRGTGLGLALAQRILEAHGGTIQAYSRPSGAEFVLLLPREGALPQTEQDVSQPLSQRLQELLLDWEAERSDSDETTPIHPERSDSLD